jgi:hypothetical protein
MVTQQKLLSGEWSPTVAKSHLKENGINEGCRNLIVRQGGNRRTFDLMKEKAERGGAGVVELAGWPKIQKEKELCPTKYSMPKTPSLWNRDLPLHLFVDTPRHRLFLGIAKSVFGKISLWSARCGRGPAFKKVGINLLKDVEELKLQWLTFNIKTFDSWGGWISEKF